MIPVESPRMSNVEPLRQRRRREERYIPIDLIDTDEMARRPREERIQAIAASIAEEGLKEPIEVAPRGDRYLLTHGWVRLEASRRVGDIEIAAVVWRGPAAKRPLRAADGNLLQDGLTVLDRALYLAAGKTLYEREHPETRNGAAAWKSQSLKSETLKPYWQVAAERYGLSRPAIFKALAVGDTIAPEAVQLLAPTDWADNQSALEQISRFSPDQQVEIARLITADPPKGLPDAIAAVAGAAPPDLAKKHWSAAWGGLDRMTIHARRDFFAELATSALLPKGVRIVIDGDA